MELRQRYEALKATQPRLRARDAASELGVTEAELASVDPTAVPLKRDWPALMKGLCEVGEVMALTRNQAAVHERTGAYENVRLKQDAHVGLALGTEIDLRIFPKAWAVAFAMEVPTRHGPRSCVQVFDTSGVAVHKVYTTAGTSDSAWRAYIEDLSDPGQDLPAFVPHVPEQRSGPEDREAFLEQWAGLQDTHDFFGLLRSHQVTTGRAFEVAEGRFTERLSFEAVQTVLEAASAQEVPIMVFVGNRGMIQIHSGAVSRIKWVGDWLNVLDPRFNLHVDRGAVAQVWKVQKPTADGTVTSVELVDAEGTVLCRFFGVRKPGQPEDERWRGVLDLLYGGG